MSSLEDFSIEQVGDPLDLAGGQAARRSQRIASEAADVGLRESQRQFDIGQARLEPFAQRAIPAFQRQAALAGAQGPEAQGLAFREFEESPATQFLRESGLALSGQGTEGERRRELERFNQGLALQDFGESFNRLGAVAGSGQAAASSLAGLGEETARQTIQAQQQSFQAQQQGLAAQQAGRSAAAETGVGLATFFAGGSGATPATSRSSATLGAPINQQDFRSFA